jgi:hypothetical protein
MPSSHIVATDSDPTLYKSAVSYREAIGTLQDPVMSNTPKPRGSEHILHGRAPLVSALILACTLGIPNTASAFDNYAGGCNLCHGDFRANNYMSRSDGTAWGDDLMGGHVSFIDGSGAQEQCNTCHMTIGETPVHLNSSGDSTRTQGCVGCHGRDEDGPDQTGDGLRAHHMGADAYLNWPGGIPGGLTCAQCHLGDTQPVGEDVQPFNFRAEGGNVLALLDARLLSRCCSAAVTMVAGSGMG